jgi:translocation and assembly module TamB
VRAWFPTAPEFAGLTIDAHAEGELAHPQHAGTVHWSGLEGVPGGAVAGELTWDGAGIETVSVTGAASSAAGVTLPFAAQIDRDAGGAFAVLVRELAWTDAQGEWWRLAQPAQVRLASPTFSVAGLQLVGEQAGLSVDADIGWPGHGRVQVRGHGLAAARLASFLSSDVDAATIDALDLEATWDDGPATLAGTVRASYAPDTSATYAIEAEFRTEADKLAFGSLRVLGSSGPVLAGEGRLPLVVAGRADGFAVQLPRDGALSLRLASTPNPAFWDAIARQTGWAINGPDVHAEFSGSLAAPRGRVEFAASSLQPPERVAGTVELPRLGDLKLVLVADDAGLALTEGIMTIDDHWVSLHGRAPWALWQEARAEREVPWRRAEFSFAADRMPMAIASRALPTLLAPEGDVSFEMNHVPGRGFKGFLWLAGASLRAIPPIGTVRDIGGRVELEKYTITMPELAAFVGGRPITITGSANIARAVRPEFDVHLASSRVPLVRQPGVVLRAGLDLRVAQTADRPAYISGTVDLGQSVFVSDLVSLLPNAGGVTAPEQRPPYFSVKTRPFADWTLAVALHGDDFLRIENPFFNGTLSADFELTGTLAEPRAIGRAWSDRGTIAFPFGSLAVSQLELSLTEQNPFEPVVLVHAGTRIYGYDVRLEVSGSANDPRLLFSSDPPLSSQAVFLMLSTGEMPDTEHAFTTSERAQRLALFVGRNLASSLGLGATSDGEDRLIVRSGEDFSREGGETIYVQYNLDGRWSLVAEKDRFDAYNGGIKFRLIDR